MKHMNVFASYLKKLRISKRVTLREFCDKNKFDPGNYSRLERGIYAPPKEDLVEKYALALGLQPGSSDWIQLFDLAAASRGEFPKDLLDDHKLVEKLPALFRTLRGSAVPADKLEALAEEIRRT